MQLLGAAGAGRDWPEGRGIFHNDAKTGALASHVSPSARPRLTRVTKHACVPVFLLSRELALSLWSLRQSFRV